MQAVAVDTVPAVLATVGRGLLAAGERPAAAGAAISVGNHGLTTGALAWPRDVAARWPPTGRPDLGRAGHACLPTRCGSDPHRVEPGGELAVTVLVLEPVAIAAIFAAPPPGSSGLTYLQGVGLFVGIPALALFVIALPIYAPVWWEKVRGHDAPDASDDGAVNNGADDTAADDTAGDDTAADEPAAPAHERTPLPGQRRAPPPPQQAPQDPPAAGTADHPGRACARRPHSASTEEPGRRRRR